MPNPRLYSRSILLSGILALSTAACSTVSNPFRTTQVSQDQATSAEAVEATSPTPSEQATASATPAEAGMGTTGQGRDPYPEAINRASLAFTLSQSAQSQDDWRLAASRWQQAIDLMASVPESSPNFDVVPQKLVDYRRNFAYARQQATRPLPVATPGRIVTVPTEDSETVAATRPSTPISSPSVSPSGTSGQVFSAPIVRRSGGTPVILVTFNGSQPFEMIVDTGASGTVITQPMAAALGVTPVGQTNVATASSRSVVFLLGYVDSLEVNGARVNDLLVAIAGPELSTGLLGHDFFGNYDVVVRQDVVEFRER